MENAYEDEGLQGIYKEEGEVSTSLPLFAAFCTVLIVCDVAIHVMIQLYFEGHHAFDDDRE